MATTMTTTVRKPSVKFEDYFVLYRRLAEKL